MGDLHKATGIRQSALSQHLSISRMADLVETRRQAQTALDVGSQARIALPVSKSAASGGRYHLAWFEPLLKDRQLVFGCPPPAAHMTR